MTGLRARLRQIKVFISDVDGVLTDGRIIVDGNGIETKFFDVQDGFGLVFLKQCDIKTVLITARPSPVVEWRAKELQIDRLFMVYPKMSAYETLKQEFGVSDAQCCFVGDDVADLTIMKKAGLAVAVKNAVFEVKQAAHFITEKCGGYGAAREVIEMILKAQGKWETALYER